MANLIDQMSSKALSISICKEELAAIEELNRGVGSPRLERASYLLKKELNDLLEEVKEVKEKAKDSLKFVGITAETALSSSALYNDSADAVPASVPRAAPVVTDVVTVPRAAPVVTDVVTVPRAAPVVSDVVSDRRATALGTDPRADSHAAPVRIEWDKYPGMQQDLDTAIATLDSTGVKTTPDNILDLMKAKHPILNNLHIRSRIRVLEKKEKRERAKAAQ